MICTRCDGCGFINWDEFLPETIYELEDILKWISENETDMQVCDCCGDGEGWYGDPGSHYGPNDPIGNDGPYAYNGGLCECN